MAKPKFLRNPKTGAKFPYNDHLAKRNPKLVPCGDNDGEPAFEQVDVDVNHAPVGTSPNIAGVGTGDGSAPSLDGKPPAGGDPQAGSGDAGGDAGNDEGAGNGQPNDEALMIGEVPLAEASKDQMVEFAQAAFGEKLDKRSGEETMRKKLASLLEEQE